MASSCHQVLVGATRPTTFAQLDSKTIFIASKIAATCELVYVLLPSHRNLFQLEPM